MKNSAIITILLLVVIIFISLQCIFVSWAQQEESPTIKKELKVPSPAFPAL